LCNASPSLSIHADDFQIERNLDQVYKQSNDDVLLGDFSCSAKVQDRLQIANAMADEVEVGRAKMVEDVRTELRLLARYAERIFEVLQERVK
jgi:hypothetical protein